MPLQKPPRGYFHNADGYWLYILVRKNSLLRANFVLSLFRPKSYQQANLSVHDFFKFALMGRAGYGIVSKKDQFALIAPNELLAATRLAFRSTSQSGNPVEPNLGKRRLRRDKLCSRLNGPVGPGIQTRWMSQTMLTVPRRDRIFHSSKQGRGVVKGSSRGYRRWNVGGRAGGREWRKNFESNSRLHNFLKKTLVWVLQITQRSADAHNTRFNLFKCTVEGDVLAIAYYY
ncbi:hypothetical protein F5880DRAFT_1509363 [Lentinula raphanica]|nr:hypothetical protein F5880DRAFT_1509363 [Lentinula raphanica]